LSVQDDGAGLRHHGQAPSEGIGLANVRSGLAQLYPGNAGMALTESPEGGVIVTVTLPFHSADRAPRHHPQC
jgi:LytS/YehU family sensor histidine kinase